MASRPDTFPGKVARAVLARIVQLGRMLGDTLDRVAVLAGGDASADDGAGLGWDAPLARYGIVAAA